MEKSEAITFERASDWKERLLMLPDLEERLRYLMDQARRAPELETADRTEERLIEGCLSNVWLDRRFEDGRCFFVSAAEAVIPRALTALLCDVYNDAEPEAVLAVAPTFIDEAGLSQFLSANRTNALGLVYGRMCDFAREHAGAA